MYFKAIKALSNLSNYTRYQIHYCNMNYKELIKQQSTGRKNLFIFGVILWKKYMKKGWEAWPEVLRLYAIIQAYMKYYAG